MKEKLKIKFNKFLKWCGENKETLAIGVPIAAATVAGTCKLAGKAIDALKEKNLQELTCYDRSLGHYWKLKRALDNDEWLAIEKRRKDGERLSDILADMKVLK